MYADNTSVICCAEEIDELCNDLRAEVDNIADWLQQNKNGSSFMLSKTAITRSAKIESQPYLSLLSSHSPTAVR